MQYGSVAALPAAECDAYEPVLPLPCRYAPSPDTAASPTPKLRGW